MRAEREDLPLEQERRSNTNIILLGAAAILLLGVLLYFGLGGSDTVESTPTPQPIVRDSAVVAPPVVSNNNTDPAPPAAQEPARGDFSERQLAPYNPTIGAGTAPVVEREASESFVIEGKLLEEIEEDAQAEDSAEE